MPMENHFGPWPTVWKQQVLGVPRLVECWRFVVLCNPRFCWKELWLTILSKHNISIWLTDTKYPYRFFCMLPVAFLFEICIQSCCLVYIEKHWNQLLTDFSKWFSTQTSQQDTFTGVISNHMGEHICTTWTIYCMCSFSNRDVSRKTILSLCLDDYMITTLSASTPWLHTSNLRQWAADWWLLPHLKTLQQV